MPKESLLNPPFLTHWYTYIHLQIAAVSRRRQRVVGHDLREHLQRRLSRCKGTKFIRRDLMTGPKYSHLDHHRVVILKERGKNN